VLATGTELFFELSDQQGQRFPGHVIEGGEVLVRIGFCEQAPAVQARQSGNVYYEARDGFVSQAFLVREVADDGSSCVIGIHGEPEVAPAREFFRVRVPEDELWCTLGDERCPVVSLSPVGLGIVSRATHAVGASIELVVHEGVTNVSGRVRVMNASATGDGANFYGLRLAPGVGEAHSRIGETLGRLCTKFQLEERRRATEERGD